MTFTENLPTTNHPQKIIEMGYDLNLSDLASAKPDGGASASAGGAASFEGGAERPLREATVAAVDPSYFEVTGTK